MADVEETRLPGVGIRHDFVTAGGRRIGLLSHLSGHRELLIYDSGDPDSCRELIELDEDDGRVLAELLGADRVTEHLGGLRQSMRGLTIDWLPIERSSSHAGRTIAETGLAARTGAAIVAVVRGAETIPSPPSDLRLEAGDTTVVAGTPDGVRQALALLQGT